MTDDLQTLRTALAPEDPPQDVVDRSRHRLQHRIGGRSAFRKRIGWLAAGTGITAAAAAAAVAISVVPPSESPPKPTDTRAPARPLTGQGVLLAAADAAEATPDGSGTWWYVRETIERTSGPWVVNEFWTKPNGENWYRGEKTAGQLVHPAVVTKNPFSLPAAEQTLDQLRALPTDPKKLKAAIIYAIKHDDVRIGTGPIKDDPKALAEFTFDSFISLVSTLPAPSAVRAAAFRAIAAYPGVEYLGPVPGGEGLLLPDGERLVVDPETGRVSGASFIVSMDGAKWYPGDENGTIRIDAKWTDDAPS
jgi:hypothetical protein